MDTLTFTVYGKPASKGSVTAHHARKRDGSLVIGYRGEPVIVKHDDNPNGKRHAKGIEATALAAREAASMGLLRGVAVAVEARFYMPSPKDRYGTGRNAGLLKDSAMLRPVTKPDADKLLRHLLDALTGVIYADDGQVVAANAEKFYADGGEPMRTEVTVTVLEKQTVGVVMAAEQLAIA